MNEGILLASDIDFMIHGIFKPSSPRKAAIRFPH